MKSSTKRIVACLLALCFMLAFVACDIPTNKPQDEKSYAYIAVDINPSVELVMADGKVESVRACNDDATVLLAGEDLSGLTAEEAIEKIVALSEELGYINDNNTDVKLTVTADDEKTAEELEEKASRGAQRGSERAVVNSNPRVADTREVKELKDENPELYKNLSPAKLRIIKSIMEYDEEMTVEKGAEMSTKELIALLDEYAKEFKGVYGDELKEKLKERKEEIKAEKKREIAEIYGKEHLEAWSKIEALKTLYKELEAKAEGAELSDEDITSVMTILGIEDRALIEKDGVVTIESIEHYIDKSLDGKLDEIEDELEAILDKYDEDEYALSEEEIARIEEILGTELEITNLEDLEELLDDAHDELDEIKDEIELTDEQKKQIEDIKDNFDSAKEQAKEEFKKEIEDAFKHFGEQKDHMRR